VRRLRRLVQKRTLRWSEGVCVIEGPDLVRAALDAGAEFEAIYVDADSAADHTLKSIIADATTRGVRAFSLAPGVLDRVADATTPQPVVAAIRLPLSDLSSVPADRLVMVLHDVRDPGNAGTLIRSADATGSGGVIFTGTSVDPFNPKTLRATVGSIFRVPVAVASLEDTIASFRARGVSVLATVVRGGRNFREVDFSQPALVVVGNEADGLDDASIALCDDSISIEMAGTSESLNAGVAGSLIAFEALWRRQDTISRPITPSL
jgi:RNA methyltransferase, TrmH family